MAVTDEIWATYRGPAKVARRLLAAERHEARALAYLLGALLVIYIAQWPGMSRAAFLDPATPMTQRMVAGLLGLMAMIPVFYGLAALGHLVARAFGGKGNWFAARIALFWALLATTPLMLLQGLVAAFVGPGAGLTATGIVVFVVFLWFWGAFLKVAEFGDAE